MPPLRRFPPLREGNRTRVWFPLQAGGTKEGVFNLACFCKLRPRDWYKMRNIMSRWVLASALGAVALTQASASIVFHFNTVHSGAVPVGSASWAVMTMNDIPGGVQIILTNSATNPTGQFIGQLNLLFTPQPTGPTSAATRMCSQFHWATLRMQVWASM